MNRPHHIEGLLMSTDLARQAVIDHALLTPANPHSHLLCSGCWAILGEAVPWPCAPLRAVADLTAIEGGWTITIRPTADQNPTTHAVPAGSAR